MVAAVQLNEQLKDKKHRQVALGKNLVVTRASNKGGVCLTIPVNLSSFDFKEVVNITFVSCHLASDKAGVSKVDKRNKNAAEIIRELSLGKTVFTPLIPDYNLL